MPQVILDGHHLTLEHAKRVDYGSKVLIHSNVKKEMEVSQKFVHQVCQGEKAVYGINTGFGYLAKHKVQNRQLKELQVNILKSHACGYGVGWHRWS